MRRSHGGSKSIFQRPRVAGSVKKVCKREEGWILEVCALFSFAMKIYFADSAGKKDVAGEEPMEAPLDFALEVFRGLDRSGGFLGVNLDERYVVQFAPEPGGVRVELLDTAGPSFDACTASAEFAEELIRAAFENHDVFAVARASNFKWAHTDL
jgi:hypothetical protein